MLFRVARRPLFGIASETLFCRDSHPLLRLEPDLFRGLTLCPRRRLAPGLFFSGLESGLFSGESGPFSGFASGLFFSGESGLFSGFASGLFLGGQSGLFRGFALRPFGGFAWSLFFSGGSGFFLCGQSCLLRSFAPGLFFRLAPGLLCSGLMSGLFFGRALGLRLCGEPGPEFRLLGVDRVALGKSLPRVWQAFDRTRSSRSQAL